jgi:TetR/AcrR family transcriptional regulator, transcriptional repressor for nem operon
MMARPTSFDRDDAIGRAAELFRQQGYEATSVRALLDHLRLSSSSFYAAFGGKEQLFMLALEVHAGTEREQLRAMLTGPSGVRAGFEDLFEALIDDLLQSGSAASLTLRAGVELAGSKPKVLAFLLRHIERMIELVAESLDEAQRRGEVALRFPPEAVARHLLFAAFDLGFMAKVTTDRAKLQQHAAIVLTALEPIGAPARSPRA